VLRPDDSEPETSYSRQSSTAGGRTCDASPGASPPRAGVRIIAASGLAVTENVVKANGAGVKDILPQPCAAETLLRRIREVPDRPATATR